MNKWSYFPHNSIVSRIIYYSFNKYWVGSTCVLTTVLLNFWTWKTFCHNLQLDLVPFSHSHHGFHNSEREGRTLVPWTAPCGRRGHRQDQEKRPFPPQVFSGISSFPLGEPRKTLSQCIHKGNGWSLFPTHLSQCISSLTYGTSGPHKTTWIVQGGLKKSPGPTPPCSSSVFPVTSTLVPQSDLWSFHSPFGLWVILGVSNTRTVTYPKVGSDSAFLVLLWTSSPTMHADLHISHSAMHPCRLNLNTNDVGVILKWLT